MTCFFLEKACKGTAFFRNTQIFFVFFIFFLYLCTRFCSFMLFNSFEFLIFLPLVFFAYWFVFDRMLRTSKHQLWCQNLFILIASYVFYGWWDWRFLILIAITSLSSWSTALGIEKSRSTRSKQAWLGANIVLNLGILATFKYFDFFVSSFCTLFGLDSTSYVLQLLLPVGISFYTFQALSYSIDVYRRKIDATKDIIAFFAYIAFFPQLVAGPIERATNLLPQFLRKRVFVYKEAADGMRRILWGLFKKIVIADNCAWYVDMEWADYANQNGFTLVLAAFLFAIQIYCDFSGYSDIAIGTARLFGFTLRENFRMPYFSRSVAEFWKRWHISLNTWFVDYVYIPLGGSREGRARTIFNTFVIFLLSGLWHGANWTYVTWGVYHAFLFVPLIGLQLTKKYQDTPSWRQLPQIIFTFVLVAVGWIIFRAPSLHDAGSFVYNMLIHINHGAPWWGMPLRINQLMIAIALLFALEWINRDKPHALSLLPRNRFLRASLYIALTCWCIFNIFAFTSGSHPFIYFQF